MTTLCKLFSVPEKHFDQDNVPASMREVDFYLFNDEKFYRCEVKLMGKGNPESADAIFARESNLFVADKLSDLNKKQAEQLNVEWVCLRDKNGYKRFGKVLQKWKIPCENPEGDVGKRMEEIIGAVLNE